MKSDQTVLQAKRYGVYTCAPDSSLREAARRMNEEDISALVVVDAQDCLIGVITHTDLLRAHCTHPDWATQRVEQFMTRDVVTVKSEDRLSSVCRLLLEKHIHRVVVTRDEDGKRRPVAVISDSDLVYHMSKED